MENDTGTEAAKSEVVEGDVGEETQDTTDYKAKLAETEARLKRAESKLERDKFKAKVEEKVETVLEKKGLDRVDKAILRVEKITAEHEIELVQDIMKETGKDLETVLESKYFQHELKALREAQATKDATPTGTKRTGQSPRNEVDYWVAKGEMPPADNFKLRADYVNAKMRQQESKKMFSDDPIV